ncbi:TetR/AcrR family transcriptional regulator [Gimesia aquarii]|uniref:Putative DNA-binding transcriptional regulator n=1 Tax=Gimesia aquarii TaxID=2527964 RepID=A0A517VZK6_9PLAN|nr:CerR family C-terminal domain-containing protein [Gimesia aquarii]QDT98438.1 putative DNA-binding transcriptional regulator [Gimesia aquarii]
MDKPTEEPLSPSEVSTRERLLQAGLEEFAAKGYDGATVRDICHRAQANLNSIKYHFGDKWELYIAVLEVCKERVGPPSLPNIPVDAKAEKQLHTFIHSLVKVILAKRRQSGDPRAMQILFREMQQPTGAMKAGIKMFVIPIWKLLNTILAKLLPEDTPEFDRHLLAFSVMGQITSYRFNTMVMDIVITKSESDRITAKRLADHITRVTVAAAHSFHVQPKTNEQ